MALGTFFGAAARFAIRGSSFEELVFQFHRGKIYILNVKLGVCTDGATGGG
jgi:hypothetical protein